MSKSYYVTAADCVTHKTVESKQCLDVKTAANTEKEFKEKYPKPEFYVIKELY